MDTLTHALSGALVARATAGMAPAAGMLPLRQRMTVAFVAGAFPDCDFALRLIDTLTYLNLHRGITHSLVMLPLWTLALSWLFSRLFRGGRPWRVYCEPVALGMLAHIAGDVITAYGTMILMPLSERQLQFALAYIIDPWFTGIIAAGLACSVFSSRGRAVAAAFLALLATYVGLQAFLQQQAVNAGRAHAGARGWAQASVAVLPQPFSPFNWKIIVAHGDGYEEANVNLIRRRAREDPGPAAWLLQRMAAGYHPPGEALWQKHWRFGESAAESELAREAWNSPALVKFRRFAAFPALDGIDLGPQETCVWFADLRFTLPGAPTSFRYGACRHGAGPWTLRRRHGAFLID